MRRYETFVIIDPDLSEDVRKPVIERIKELIAQKNGTLVLVDEWGQRRLAYEIKTKTRGYYVRFDYCGDGPLVDEIERFCRIEDGALKYMTVVLDKDIDMAAVQKEMAENQARAEAAAKTASEEKAKESEPLSVTSETPTEDTDETEPSNIDEESADEQ